MTGLLIVPIIACFVLLDDQTLYLFGAELPILVTHPHIDATIGIIGRVAAFEDNVDTVLRFDCFLLDAGVYLWLYVVGDCLRDVPERLFTNLCANNRAVVLNAEKELALPVLVEDGGYGYHHRCSYAQGPGLKQ